MTFRTLWRLLGAGFLFLLLLVIAGIVLLRSTVARQEIEKFVRQRLAENTDLVVSPFTVEFSALRDFPHITIAVGHLALTDTAHQRAVPVLRVDRAEARLELNELLHGRVRVRQLRLVDIFFHQEVDSLGRQWGLRGKRRASPGKGPTLHFALDSVILQNLHISTRNGYKRSYFAGVVQRASLTARVNSIAAQLHGNLAGQLQTLRTNGDTLFFQAPVRATVNYRYSFRRRQGRLWNTYATLYTDTLRVSGTHTAASEQPTGAHLHFQIEGTQPLLSVLRTTVPNALQPYLAGARSQSKAHIRYSVDGLSGPVVRPHNVLQFRLRGATVVWPDSGRAIRHWDLLGKLDNGAQHGPKTTTLQIAHCRVFSSVGELDAELLLRDFTRPYLQGHLRGRTELRHLATLVAPGLWHARGGIATLDVAMRGPLRYLTSTSGGLPDLSLRGKLTLDHAAFTVPGRGATISNLHVRLGLQDSLWTLSDLSGRLDGMNFRANATTVNLLNYLTERVPVTTITGTVAVDALRVPHLRYLLAAPGQVSRRRQPTSSRPDLMKRYANLFPTGLHLDVQLRCNQLLLPLDTLSQLAVRVRHDGHHVRLTDLKGQVWDGSVRGQATWPTDSTGRIRPMNVQLALKFGTIDYLHLLTRIAHPRRNRKPGSRPPKGLRPPPDPSLRELLLTSSGRVTCDIAQVTLPAGENLQDIRLRFDKQGQQLRVPYLTFSTSAGGSGKATATAQLEGIRLASANASVDFRYATLDIQRLLQLLAALNPPNYLFPPRPSRMGAARPAAASGVSPFFNGTITAQVRVQADQVQYVALRGTQFRLRSSLRAGQAQLEECSLKAFGGDVMLRGALQTNAGADHHPLHAQARLRNMQLPAVFSMASMLNFDVLGSENVRGTADCEADFHTDLDAEFVPRLHLTQAYLKTNIQNLELLDMRVLQDALKFLSKKRVGHLYFEPVNTAFFLDRGRILIPDLHLNSNLTSMAVSGEYNLLGQANLYVGMNPLQVIFGNNSKRVARIEAGKLVRRTSSSLTYLNLRRTPGSNYKVRLFKQNEQRQQQEALREQSQQLLIEQRLDTTMRLLR